MVMRARIIRWSRSTQTLICTARDLMAAVRPRSQPSTVKTTLCAQATVRSLVWLRTTEPERVRIQRKFLSSRAGRRIFWALLLAAAAPIAVFGAMTYHLLSQQFETHVAKQQVQLLKFAGMGLLDRLLVARTTLSIVARTGRVDSGYDAGSRSGRVLLDIAYVNSRGHLLAGNAALAQRWRN